MLMLILILSLCGTFAFLAYCEARDFDRFAATVADRIREAASNAREYAMREAQYEIDWHKADASNAHAALSKALAERDGYEMAFSNAADDLVRERDERANDARLAAYRLDGLRAQDDRVITALAEENDALRFALDREQRAYRTACNVGDKRVARLAARNRELSESLAAANELLAEHGLLLAPFYDE